MLTVTSAQGPMSDTASNPGDALSFMKRNALCYSQSDLRTLNGDSLKYMLKVLGNAEKSLADISTDVEIVAWSTEHGQESPLLDDWKRGIREVSDIIDNAKDVLGGILNLSSGEDLSIDRSRDIMSLSPKLSRSVVVVNGMYSTLYMCGGPVYSNYSISINTENTILSLSHLTNTIHRLCGNTEITSCKDLALLNTSTRALSVVAESLHQLAMVVGEEMADRIHRCVMMVVEVSLLVSPHTPISSVESLRSCSVVIARSAAMMSKEVGSINVSDSGLLHLANGLKSVVDYAVDVYVNMLEQVSAEGEGTNEPVSYSDFMQSYSQLLGFDTSNVMHIRSELLEAILHASLFELRYLESVNGNNSISKSLHENGAIERHIRKMKLSLMYALVGMCECADTGDSRAEDRLIMDCAGEAALCSLESLERILRCLDEQPLSKKHRPALRSLECVATLVNRALDRLDEKRKLYWHNWNPGVSGVVLFPEELPKNRKLLKTTAGSSLDALRKSFEEVVENRFIAFKKIMLAVIGCIVGFFVMIYELSVGLFRRNHVYDVTSHTDEAVFQFYNAQPSQDINGCNAVMMQEGAYQQGVSGFCSLGKCASSTDKPSSGNTTKVRSELFVDLQKEGGSIAETGPVVRVVGIISSGEQLGENKLDEKDLEDNGVSVGTGLQCAHSSLVFSSSSCELGGGEIQQAPLPK